jgi:hypothetical protein
VDAAFASLPAELSRGLDPSMPNFGALQATWYDARIYQLLLDALLATQPDVDRVSLARDAGRTLLDQTLHGIYAKLFQLMATPSLYARYVQKMWDMHYDTGKVTIVHRAPNVAVNQVYGWAGHHPFACAINRQSGAVVYSKMGLKNVRIESERCTPPLCESVYAWDE